MRRLKVGSNRVGWGWSGGVIFKTMNMRDTGQSSRDSVVLPPSLPATKELIPSDYIFNSVGFYASLKERLEDQRGQLLNIYSKLKRPESSS